MEKLEQTLREMRTANPLFYFTFNCDQWSSDDALGLLTDYQRGWFIQLTVAAWKSSAVLENDDEKLFRLAKADSREQWEREKHQVLDFFDEAVDADGVSVLVHRTLRPHWVGKLDKYTRKLESVAKAREAKAAQQQERVQ